MRKLSFGGLAVIALGMAIIVPSQIGRAQSAGRFEYVRVTPYTVNPMNPARIGYRACVASTGEWLCRQFESSDSSGALRTALATLGNEGWELVSAVDDPPGTSIPEGLTYLFKRQRQ
jgi:hypothetical protein